MLLYDIAPDPYSVPGNAGSIGWIIAGVVAVAVIAVLLILRARKK